MSSIGFTLLSTYPSILGYLDCYRCHVIKKALRILLITHVFNSNIDSVYFSPFYLHLSLVYNLEYKFFLQSMDVLGMYGLYFLYTIVGFLRALLELLTFLIIGKKYRSVIKLIQVTLHLQSYIVQLVYKTSSVT